MFPCCAWCGADLVGEGSFAGWQTLELLSVVVGWHRSRCRAFDPAFLEFLRVLERSQRDEELTLEAWRKLLDAVVLRGPGRTAISDRALPDGPADPPELAVASAYVRTAAGLIVDRGAFPLKRKPGRSADDTQP